MNDKAIVVFSGGQDSTTCLYWAKDRFKSVTAITFDYGQRHKIEIEQSEKIAKLAEVDQSIVELSNLSDLTSNALTDSSVEIEEDGELPTTFVAGRNLLFLTYASIIGYESGAFDIVIGASEEDYSGYPDCRELFTKSFNKTVDLAMDREFFVRTPLMHLSKAQTVELAVNLDCLDALALSHTCYEGRRPACGKCPACRLRLKGFKEAGISDPLEYEKST